MALQGWFTDKLMLNGFTRKVKSHSHTDPGIYNFLHIAYKTQYCALPVKLNFLEYIVKIFKKSFLTVVNMFEV